MRGMTKEEVEYAAIKNAIRIIAVMCAASEDKIIDCLTGYCFDEEEAGDIKRSDGFFHVCIADDAPPPIGEK